MAYGKILVDQVENSDGKSLNVGPGARVFDTVTELQASTTLSDGDIVIVKERANAEYEIQSSAYTALDGDLTLTSGQVAELLVVGEIHVSKFGIVGDGSDEVSSVYDAMSRCSTEGAILDFTGIESSVASTLYIPEGTVVRNLSLQAIGTSWSSNTADADSDLVGLPIVAVESQNVRLLGETSLDCGLTTIDSDNEDIAAAGLVYLEGSQNNYSEDIFVTHYLGYGVWFRGKHTDSYHGKIETKQWDWGETGWYDVSTRTAYGVVNSSGDFSVEFVVSNYNKSNIHIIEGAFTTMWDKVHPYNGSDEAAALDNITMTGGIAQMFGLVYLDNGYITMTDAFWASFGIIRQVKTTNATNQTVFRLITSNEDEDASELYVGETRVSVNRLVTYDTTGSGSWSDNKKHIFKTVTRTGTQSNYIFSSPHENHLIVQTYGDRKRYEINSDGGSAVVDSDIGLMSVRETLYGSLFSGVRLGGIGAVNIAGNPDSDVTVQPSSTDTFARLQFSGSNGTDFGSDDNPDVGMVQINARANEDWTSTAMGSYLEFKVTDTGGTSTVTPLTLSSTAVHSSTPDTFSLGVSWSKWTQVYATNGTINTSDARLKTDLVELTDDEVNAAVAISKAMGYTWQWLENGDRTHTGPTVQLIMGIMEDNNLTPFDYSFICYDEWEDQIEKVEVTPAVLDEDGNVVTEAVYEDQVVLEAGDRYSFRENELVKFCNAGLSARLDSQQETIDSILSRLDSLES